MCGNTNVRSNALGQLYSFFNIHVTQPAVDTNKHQINFSVCKLTKTLMIFGITRKI